MLRTLFVFGTALAATIGGIFGWRDPESGGRIDGGPEYLKPLVRPAVPTNHGRVIAISEAKRIRKQRARLARKGC